jgi:hypothetical protein
MDAERHILRIDEHSDYALLAMATDKLVAKLWDAVAAHLDLDELTALNILGDENAVDCALFCGTDTDRSIAKLGTSYFESTVFFHEPWGACATDEYVSAFDFGLLRNKAVVFELTVSFSTVVATYPFLGNGESVLGPTEILFTLSLVNAVEAAVSEAALDSGFVENDGILHVVATAAEDSDYEILAAGALVEPDDLHWFCANSGLLGVVE